MFVKNFHSLWIFSFTQNLISLSAVQEGLRVK